MDIIVGKLIKISKMILIFGGFFVSNHSFANLPHTEGMIELNDTELSKVQGQALMSLGYIAPNDAANKMQGQGVGFYKLGMEAELELNANIKKLQLGCGGINGAGGCDIDIDNLSLSGLADTREGRAGSSAKLTNPFLEFAIKNPDAASTREVVGLRLSAEKVLGMLTAGTENSETPNGINSLSGFLKTKATTGLGYTNSRGMSYTDTQMPITGNVDVCVLFFCGRLPLSSTDYNLTLQSTTAPIQVDSATINGMRQSSVNLTGKAYIDRLNFGGRLKAGVKVPLLGTLNLEKQVNGDITGLTANLSISESLGYIHKIPLNNPFSLSLQSQNVWWPNAEVTAQRGWWMAFEDAVDIGNVTPSKGIDITNDVLKQVVGPLSNALATTAVPSCQALDCLLGSSLEIGNINLPNTSVNFPLQDLQLKNQDFAPNCYGSLKFC